MLDLCEKAAAMKKIELSSTAKACKKDIEGETTNKGGQITSA